MEWKPRPWLAAVLGLLVTPLGMLYVQRPWVAVGYLAASFGAGLAAFFSMWAFGSEPIAAVLALLGWLISIACALHAYRIARDGTEWNPRRWYTRWYGLASFPLILFSVAFLVRSFCYEPFRVRSDSMYPSVPANSIVLVKKAGFGHYGTYGLQPWSGAMTASVRRGDLVIHQLPTDPAVSYVRRVIAVPGDHVQYREHRLVINGKDVPVRTVRDEGDYRIAVEKLDGRDVPIAFMRGRPALDIDQVVPSGHYVMFGDSRDNARDSRIHGLVAQEYIVGRVAFVLRPGGAPSL